MLPAIIWRWPTARTSSVHAHPGDERGVGTTLGICFMVDPSR